MGDAVRLFLRTPMLLWLSALLVYVIATFYLSYLWLSPLPEQYQLTRAYVIHSNASTPRELAGLKHTEVSLPDWDTAAKHNITDLWYVIPFLNSGSEPQRMAVYLPNISQNVEVFINNQWIGNGGRMVEPISRNRNHPQLFNFDHNALERQRNFITIRLKGQFAKSTYLGAVYTGPQALLQHHFSKNTHLRIDLVTTITLSMVFSSIFISILWLFRQTDSYYLFYAVFSLLWTFHDSNHFLRTIPLPLASWEVLSSLSFGYAMIGVVMFIHRYAGQFPKQVEYWMIGITLVLSIPFAHPDTEWAIRYSQLVWNPALATLGFYTLGFVIIHYIKHKETRLIPIITAGSGLMIYGMHDLILVLQLIPKQSPFMIHFAALLVVVVIATTLINRFVQSMNVVEHYNRELQNEVKRKTDDIEHGYRQVKQLTQKYTLAEERQRIMRDIHDGIGGQLVATLVSLESGNVSQEQIKANLKSALQDLRMVIDSLDYEAEDLPTLLGMLRMRLADQLANARLTLHWKVDDLPPITNFGPANVLNTMRIVQEAITNTLKHSRADNLTIETSIVNNANDQQIARICIYDDGCGTLPPRSSGRGLLNMQKRADLIGAKLRIDSRPGQGLQVTLEIPVPETQTTGKH